MLVTALSLFLALRSVPVGDLLHELTDIRPEWLAATLLAQGISLLARAARSHALLHGLGRYSDIFWPQAVGLLLTNIVPFRAGEAARALLVSRRLGLPIGHVGASIVVENVLDVVMVMLLLVACIPLMPVPPVVAAAGLALGGAVGVVVVGLVLVVWLNERAERLAGAFAHLLPSRFRGFVRAQWSGSLAGLGALGSIGVAARALGYTLVIWLCAVASFWAVIEAVVPGARILEPAFAVTGITLGAAIPSTPGSLGVFELAGQAALVTPFPDRYTPASALSVAILAHALFYVLTLVLGAVALARLGVSLGGAARGE